MNTSGHCFITIEGKRVGILFGLPAIAALAEKESKPNFFSQTEINGELTKTYSIYGITYIIYEGYVNYCAAESADQVISYRSFYDLVENAFAESKINEVITPVLECFHNSRYIKPIKDKTEREASKKKSSTGKK